MSELSFTALPLGEPLQRALADLHYAVPSPIQAAAIPPQLEGRDIIGSAQTGTGKTAAFCLPILQHLHTRPKRTVPGQPRVLVLVPTRELAVQVGDSFQKYGKYLGLRHALAYGGVSAFHQLKALRTNVDILVATPGRLMDYMNQRLVSLAAVEFLVLDEVDRMLDMGFIHDVRRIVQTAPADRQTALFSATFPSEVMRLARDFVQDPVKVEIDPGTPVVERIFQQVGFLREENKLNLLEKLLNGEPGEAPPYRTLVFTRTRHGADKLSRKLKGLKIDSEAIHGNRTQASRQKALNRFKEGKVPVLVATDVAARGIDVKDIALVINYDLPEDSDTYVHRIGRTARAEARGRSVTFAGIDQVREFLRIQRSLNLQIDVLDNHDWHEADWKNQVAMKEKSPRGGGQRSFKARKGRNTSFSRKPAPSSGPGEFSKGPRSFQKRNRGASAARF